MLNIAGVARIGVARLVALKIMRASARTERLEARERAQSVHKKSVKEKILCLRLQIFSFTD
jgi:hypothetical protein